MTASEVPKEIPFSFLFSEEESSFPAAVVPLTVKSLTWNVVLKSCSALMMKPKEKALLVTEVGISF